MTLTVPSVIQESNGTRARPGGAETLVRFRFGEAPERLEPGRVGVRLSPLTAATDEVWRVPGPVERDIVGRCGIARTRDLIVVHADAAMRHAGDLAAVTHDAYAEALGVCRASGYARLVRAWNYLPGINVGSGDDEAYRRFCSGRARAFEAWLRPGEPLPAGTAIGGRETNVVTIAILAAADHGRLAVRMIENPRQVSAYRYPRRYGPKSPSFSRAALLSAGSERLLIISGTSSIVGHATVHPHRLPAQVDETRRNIEALIKAARGVAGSESTGLRGRFYLRHAGEREAAERAFAASFADAQRPVFLAGDICRAALVMEIEGTVRLC